MFGIEIFDAGLFTSIIISFFAGVLSFLSPCVLPIVPPYIAYMSGMSMSHLSSGKSKTSDTLLPALMFVVGLSTVFLILGLVASTFGNFLLSNQQIMGQISGIIVIIVSLHFLRIFRVPFLEQDIRFEVKNNVGNALGAYVLGLAFAFGWTPCIGPQLGAILALAANEGSVLKGTSLLAIYAVGLGVPFLISALFVSQSVTIIRKLQKHMLLVERLMGLLLLVVGILLFTGGFSKISFFLLDVFPFLAYIG